MLSGTISGQDYFDDKLRAKAGQQRYLSFSIDGTNGYGSAYIDILPPGGDYDGIDNASTDNRTTTVDLPESGGYTIRAYLMGNNRDAGKTAGYRIDVSIQ